MNPFHKKEPFPSESLYSSHSFFQSVSIRTGGTSEHPSLLPGFGLTEGLTAGYETKPPDTPRAHSYTVGGFSGNPRGGDGAGGAVSRAKSFVPGGNTGQTEVPSHGSELSL